MRIQYKDFFPGIKKEGIFSDEYETLGETLDKVNNWIVAENINVINVETVVLPNVEDDEDASSVGSHSSGDSATFWSQFIRVWYSLS